MSRMVITFTVYRLTNSIYSVPLGSYGYIEGEKDIEGDWAFVHWLPPVSFSSGPIHSEDLEETGHSISIPWDTLTELGWVHETPTSQNRPARA